MRTIASLFTAIALGAVGVVAVVPPSAAGVLTAPTFHLSTPARQGLALAANGDVGLLGWTNGTLFFSRLRGGALPELPAEIVVDGPVYPGAAVTALASGDWAVAWAVSADDENFTADVFVSIRRPDGSVRLTILVAAAQVVAQEAEVEALANGFLVVWRDGGTIRGRRYHDDGDPQGTAFTIGIGAGAQETPRVRPLPGGGFVAAWGGFAFGIDTRVRAFDASNLPLSPTFLVASSFASATLAVSEDGTRAAVAGVPSRDDPHADETRLRIFAPDGSFITDDLVLPGVARPSTLLQPDVLADPSGTFLVVFGTSQGLATARFDGAGTLVEPTTLFWGGRGPGVQVLRRRQNDYLVASASGVAEPVYFASFLSLCGGAVCGDGIFAPFCEECDAGGANSDTASDACRTTCRLPLCGDGVLDAGESCDDGNRIGCDGCDELCAPEVGATCGDGVLGASGCGEQCDDGNTVVGDGCTTGCDLERAPGGGSKTTDCLAAWQIDNASNVPLYDKYFDIQRKQRCTDGDAACDFDGAANGSCTFHVAVCANNTTAVACPPAIMRTWTLRTPSEKKALADPALAAIHAAFAAVVPANVVGTAVPDRCSPMAAVPVPLRGDDATRYRPGKVSLKATAESYDGRSDTDVLMLRCDPAP